MRRASTSTRRRSRRRAAAGTRVPSRRAPSSTSCAPESKLPVTSPSGAARRCRRPGSRRDRRRRARRRPSGGSSSRSTAQLARRAAPRRRCGRRRPRAATRHSSLLALTRARTVDSAVVEPHARRRARAVASTRAHAHHARACRARASTKPIGDCRHGATRGFRGATRLRCLEAAAGRTVRMARAVRPCLPMTLPRSSSATVSSMTVGALLVELLDLDLVGLVDQRLGDELDQLLQLGWSSDGRATPWRRRPGPSRRPASSSDTVSDGVAPTDSQCLTRSMSKRISTGSRFGS